MVGKQHSAGESKNVKSEGGVEADGSAALPLRSSDLALARRWAEKSISLSPNCCQCVCNWRTSNRFKLPWLSPEIERRGGRFKKLQ